MKKEKLFLKKINCTITNYELEYCDEHNKQLIKINIIDHKLGFSRTHFFKTKTMANYNNHLPYEISESIIDNLEYSEKYFCTLKELRKRKINEINLH